MPLADQSSGLVEGPSPFAQPTTVFHKLRKLWRFVTIYGPGRTLSKAAGRLRFHAPILTFRKADPDIGIAGCGQYGYATIGYFIFKAFGPRLIACYDINKESQKSMERAYGVRASATSFEDLLTYKQLKTLYIASNHASHATYAIAAIKHGVDVYIEKPIVVTYEQLVVLLRAMRGSSSRVFAGYNRPFSSAIRTLRGEILVEPNSPFSIQCFVSGHKLSPDHWYRDPKEGTRICGNVGHWLDLALHIISWRGLPDTLDISLAVADRNEPDDNLVINLTSERGDLISLMFSSRCEPFEGISESINIQHGCTICSIDDFRRMTIWQGARIISRRFWPKDNGHKLAILQPYQGQVKRDWQEVVLSTLLMLHVADMVRNHARLSSFSLRERYGQLLQDINARSLAN